ncbi:MAG: GNAT family N-acetyltransferase [Eubacteriales bacterium]|nr:GNAT family N-acetyltransferase [Eubacteriales bacterium]
MTITFKVIEKVDAETISRILYIEQEAFGDGALSEYVVVPYMRYGKVYAAVDEEDNIISCAYFMRDMGDISLAYILSIATLTAYRGHDVGTALLNYAFSHIKRFGIEKIQLTVDPANFKALSVYREKLGFTVADISKDEDSAGDDRLIMTKDL